MAAVLVEARLRIRGVMKMSSSVVSSWFVVFRKNQPRIGILPKNGTSATRLVVCRV